MPCCDAGALERDYRTLAYALYNSKQETIGKNGEKNIQSTTFSLLLKPGNLLTEDCVD
jgi:hypothetical protein